MSIIKIQNNIFKNKICFVFDFDGVIKDSVHVKSRAFLKIYENQEKEILRKVKNYHLKNGGMPRFKKFKYYEQSLLNKKVSEDEINELCSKFSFIVKDEVINSKPIPGVISFLDELLGKNKLTAINSATPLQELNDIICQCKYRKYFNKIYGSPLSKSENLLSIMNDFNINSQEIVFFGDAESDLCAAKELNIAFVGVGNYLKNMNIKQDQKYLFINDFNELI
tara:strand:+ start:574 stop:1242 length:669 start_codon:yes stop_codon:yes gene_type:complete